MRSHASLMLARLEHTDVHCEGGVLKEADISVVKRVRVATMSWVLRILVVGTEY